jgi:hypothetical protein
MFYNSLCCALHSEYFLFIGTAQFYMIVNVSNAEILNGVIFFNELLF